jgi:hypothetical protein
MSNWNVYSNLVPTTEASFNEPVGGSKYLGIGKHTDVRIDGVELATTRQGEPYVKFQWVNAEGQSHRDSIFLYTNKDGVRDYHFSLKRFASGMIEDRELRMLFFKALVGDPTGNAFNSLVGFRATIEIGNGRKGYVVNKTPLEDGYVIYDMVDKANVTDQVFNSYGEANDYAKELGLERAWPETKSISRASEEYSKQNEAAARAIIESVSSPSGSAARQASGMSRLRGPAI